MAQDYATHWCVLVWNQFLLVIVGDFSESHLFDADITINNKRDLVCQMKK